MGLWQYLLYLAHFITVGNFVIIDLIALTTNALNGALLVQRPDYYRSNQWSIVGILIRVEVPYFSGSRVPSRFRLGPLITRMVPRLVSAAEEASVMPANLAGSPARRAFLRWHTPSIAEYLSL